MLASRPGHAAPAHPELVKALRILRAEQKDGCRNRVVMGGLEKFMAHLVQTADTPIARAAASYLDGYAALATAERAHGLAQAIDILAASAPTPEPGRGPQPAAPASSNSAAPVPAATRSTSVGALLAAPAPSAAQTSRTARPSTPANLSPRIIPSLPPPAGLSLDSPIESLKGIGPQRARHYTRLGLLSIRDLLFHFPLRHQPYPAPVPIDALFFQSEGSVVGTLERLEVERLPRSLTKLKATVRDDTGTVSAVWLRHGQPHLGVQPGDSIALSGKLLQTGRQLTFDNPDFERGDASPLHTRGLVPVYPLTAGLFDKDLRARVYWAVVHFADALTDPLPATLSHALDLPGLADAIRTLHFPRDMEAFERARRRFAFEELLTIQLVVLRRRLAWQRDGAPSLPRNQEALDALVAGLPFTLTSAQQRVSDEILADLAESRPMTRLLQGEVGSGKTAVAALALLNAVANGFQGALMAPTEILAEQHFATLTRLYQAAGDSLQQHLGRVPSVALLTGSTKGKERKSVYARAADGAVDVLVGTQALIQDTLDFANLAIVVVDEQHRFGVKQRVTLRQRAQEAARTPHLLVMTATPIPRTLQLSIHGDLDLSAIDEIPPGRPAIKTVLLGDAERAHAYERIRRAVEHGQQAFIICPLVEESEALEAKAATEEFERLRQEDLSTLRLGLLHGRMKPSEKDAVMRAFRDGDFDVLVSTAVVEVGVDIPNATVMLIEGAERFGLAQLHQFRGRIGRGQHGNPVCILLSGLDDPSANERLRVVARSSSGLALAEHDLRLRGPGDYFGVRQSGFPALRVARLDDAPLVEAARSAATRLLDEDPDLARPEHAPLAAHVTAFLARAGDPS